MKYLIGINESFNNFKPIDSYSGEELLDRFDKVPAIKFVKEYINKIDKSKHIGKYYYADSSKSKMLIDITKILGSLLYQKANKLYIPGRGLLKVIEVTNEIVHKLNKNIELSRGKFYNFRLLVKDNYYITISINELYLYRFLSLPEPIGGIGISNDYKIKNYSKFTSEMPKEIIEPSKDNSDKMKEILKKLKKR